jgi:hypothetical protein
MADNVEEHQLIRSAQKEFTHTGQLLGRSGGDADRSSERSDKGKLREGLARVKAAKRRRDGGKP